MATATEGANASNGVLTPQQYSMMVKVIDALAGEEANLQIDVEELTFHIGKAKHVVSGKVNFNVFHVEQQPEEPKEG